MVIAGSFFGYMVSAWLSDRLGLQANGRAFSPVGAFFTELFPSRLCDSGQGFSYNFGRGIGALFPTLVGYLSVRMGLGHAILTFSALACLTMVFAALAYCRRRADAN